MAYKQVYANDMILSLREACTYIKRHYFDYEIVKFYYEGQPFQLEMRFTLTSQKILL